MSYSKEQWKAIPGYEGLYEVSSHGRVRSVAETSHRKKRILRQHGYSYRRRYRGVMLYDHIEKRQSRYGKITLVHRLVMLAFVGPVPEGQQVNHRNADPSDNRLENLEYVTACENMQHASRILQWQHGTRNSQARLDEAKVRQIRQCVTEGQTHQAVADAFNIDRRHVGQIVRRVRWGWLT